MFHYLIVKILEMSKIIHISIEIFFLIIKIKILKNLKEFLVNL